MVKLLPKPVGRAANTSFCEQHVLQLTSAQALNLERQEDTSDFQKSLP